MNNEINKSCRHRESNARVELSARVLAPERELHNDERICLYQIRRALYDLCNPDQQKGFYFKWKWLVETAE